ncbi:MAG: tetrahydrofolate dehydrogenase/cyclohydrolase catalytic domain-containing protein [Solirubrobacteraceae bacterium]
MTADIIDCERVAAEEIGRVTEDLEALRSAGVPVGLATVVIGDDAVALGERDRLERSASALGISCESVHLPESASDSVLVSCVRSLGADPWVSGIVLLPPPSGQLDESPLRPAIEPVKDVEATGPENLGLLAMGRPRYVPARAGAAYALLDAWIADHGHDPEDFYRRSRIVVVGGVNDVTTPAVLLGCMRQAPVASVDPGSSIGPQFGWYTRHADVLIVAAGAPALIRAEHVREGAIVLDAGGIALGGGDATRGAVGDVLFEEVVERALALTAGPEGISDVGTAVLMGNVVRAARAAGRQDLHLVGGRS